MFGVQHQHRSSKHSAVRFALIPPAHNSHPQAISHSSFRGPPAANPLGALGGVHRTGVCRAGWEPSVAPLAQRRRSPPGGPRPAQAASDKESEGRGAAAPAPGNPGIRRGSPIAPVDWRGWDLGSGTCGCTADRGVPHGWVCPFPPAGLPARRRAPERGYFVPQDRFCLRQTRIQKCNFAAGSRVGPLGGSGKGRSGSCRHPPGGGGLRERGQQGWGSSHGRWEAARLAPTRVPTVR